MKQTARVVIGQVALPLGQLNFVAEGARAYSAFAYDASWLSARERFAVSPDLPLVAGHQAHRAAGRDDLAFHHAIADTEPDAEPDAWGRRVILRAHTKARAAAQRRAATPAAPARAAAASALTPFDILAAVDDFSRIGALRLQDGEGRFLGHAADGMPRTPPLVELPQLLGASRALEAGTESAAELRYLQGRGTSLGGMRPKCTLIDADGSLAIGKFPSLGDTRAVERGEVLALRLAARAGIDVARARIEPVAGMPVAVITRFDRTLQQARIPYLSAMSMLQARRDEDRAYTELADVIRAVGAEPTADLHELWRRMLFNLLISNSDDHLRNLGFLHVGRGLWKLAPAFDLNPMPDKAAESKTWLAEDAGPITDVAALLGHAAYFALKPAQALAVLAEVRRAVAAWRTVATSRAVGLTRAELDDFAPAFEHAAMHEARRLLV